MVSENGDSSRFSLRQQPSRPAAEGISSQEQGGGNSQPRRRDRVAGEGKGTGTSIRDSGQPALRFFAGGPPRHSAAGTGRHLNGSALPPGHEHLHLYPEAEAASGPGAISTVEAGRGCPFGYHLWRARLWSGKEPISRTSHAAVGGTCGLDAGDGPAVAGWSILRGNPSCPGGKGRDDRQ